MFALLKSNGDSYESTDKAYISISVLNSGDYQTRREIWNNTIADALAIIRDNYKVSREKGSPKFLGWKKERERLAELNLTEEAFLENNGFVEVDFDTIY